jgi:hypothetical protein
MSEVEKVIEKINRENEPPPPSPEEILNAQQLFVKNCASAKFAATRDIFASKLGTNNCSEMWDIFLKTNGDGGSCYFCLTINVDSQYPIDLEFFSPMDFKDTLELYKGVIADLSKLEKWPSIEKLHISKGGTIALGPVLDLSRTKLESISYDFGGKSVEYFTAIRDALVKVPNLEFFSFRDVQFDNIGLQGLDRSTITGIVLGGIKGFSIARDGDVLQKMANLDVVVFSSMDDLLSCTFLQKAPKLTQLWFYNMNSLSSVVNCMPKSTEFLNVWGGKGRLDLANADSLGNSNLYALDILGQVVDSDQLLYFPALAELKYSGLGSRSFMMEPIKNHPTLRILKIDSSDIDPTSCPVDGTNAEIVEFCKKFAAGQTL